MAGPEPAPRAAGAAAILGLGQVSAVGAGLDALREALSSARPPEPTWLPCGPTAAAAGASESGEKVPALLAPSRGVEKLADPRALRRLDPFAQRVLFAALLAMKDCREPGEGAGPERAGVIVATGRGPLATTFQFLDETFDRGDGLGSPITFANSVHGSAAAAISSSLGLRGPMITVAGFDSPWTEALAMALDWLERGAADRVVLASGDELHRVAGYGIARRGGFAPDGRMRPLDLERCTYVPGETFTAFVLGRSGARHGFVGWPDAVPPDRRAPVFLAACGDSREGPGYLEAARAAPAVAAYTSLWGANPTAEAMTVMAAALSISDGRLYPVPERDCTPGIAVLRPEDHPEPPAAIRCVGLASSPVTVSRR